MKIPRIAKCKKCSKIQIGAHGYCVDHYDRENDYFPRRTSYSTIGRMKNSFGVEIECYSNHNLNYVEYNTYDCSVNPHFGAAYEIKFVADFNRGAAIRKAMKVCRQLQETGADANESCGLHVHFNMPISFGRYSYRFENIYRVCKSIERPLIDIFDRIGRHDYVETLYSDMCRDSWINYRSDLKTMEVRVHEGTVNPYILHDWMWICRDLQKLCLDASDMKETKRIKSALKGDLSGVLTSPSSIRYMNKRTRTQERLRTFIKEYQF